MKTSMSSTKSTTRYPTTSIKFKYSRNLHRIAATLNQKEEPVFCETKRSIAKTIDEEPENFTLYYKDDEDDKIVVKDTRVLRNAFLTMVPKGKSCLVLEIQKHTKVPTKKTTSKKDGGDDGASVLLDVGHSRLLSRAQLKEHMNNCKHEYCRTQWPDCRHREIYPCIPLICNMLRHNKDLAKGQHFSAVTISKALVSNEDILEYMEVLYKDATEIVVPERNVQIVKAIIQFLERIYFIQKTTLKNHYKAQNHLYILTTIANLPHNSPRELPFVNIKGRRAREKECTELTQFASALSIEDHYENPKECKEI